eukprot:598842-Prymnesium_polylepis.1
MGRKAWVARVRARRAWSGRAWAGRAWSGRAWSGREWAGCGRTRAAWVVRVPARTRARRECSAVRACTRGVGAQGCRARAPASMPSP